MREKARILDATALKLTAVLLMLLDHIHQMFSPAGAPLWLTMAGRSAFPLFLFAASESFHYTRSKRRFLLRLLAAGWGMTILTFFLQNAVPNEDVVLMNNAFGTLFVSGLYMLFWDGFADGLKNRNAKKIVKALLCCLIPVLCALPLFLTAMLSFQENVQPQTIRLLAMLSLLIPSVFSVEGGFSLVVLGAAFYALKKHRIAQIAALLVLSVASLLIDGGFQWMMCFAAVPMALYNGKKGAGMKGFFYVFYPAHIAVFYIISALFF